MLAEKHSPPYIKICGITNVADALMAANLGVNAIGLVFYAPSTRAVSVSQAAVIVNAVGPFVTVVGLFVNASADDINQVLQQVPLHVLQFHGDEPAEFCAQFHRPWIKALRMKPDLDIQAAVIEYTSASAILLDSYKAGMPGGTGEIFDWNAAPKKMLLPLILAGGLDASNVARAIHHVNPYAVDVSGGVENSPGKKDLQKMKAFIEAVKKCERV